MITVLHMHFPFLQGRG